MNTEQTKLDSAGLYNEGRYLWREYIRVNGSAFNPTQEGISKLARLLDLSPDWIRVRIKAYLGY